jgi:uncharacterized protein HemX
LGGWRITPDGDRTMSGLKISFAVVAFVIIQGVAVIWYVSKLDSRVDQMYKSFEEENKKSVIENQVKMKLDLENLMQDVKQIKKDLRQGKSKDKEIMDQHKQLFNLLNSSTDMMQQNQTKGGSYSYGD